MKPESMKVHVAVQITGGNYSSKTFGSAERTRQGELDPETVESMVRDMVDATLADAIRSLDTSLEIERAKTE